MFPSTKPTQVMPWSLTMFPSTVNPACKTLKYVLSVIVRSQKSLISPADAVGFWVEDGARAGASGFLGSRTTGFGS
ncbi:hypothetical protein L602_001500000370 [Cupriavidus gilardii J11]|uniref:Uncharacterized protein n=1 Tax=Cupriavidus gilardii J11 TaxID=936133 RepID=A0A562BRY8_9BURK|nr:hypothetical protein L602_001500000370 [Cupriavidus gilardii J11]